jgi:hypothetical protein
VQQESGDGSWLGFGSSGELKLTPSNTNLGVLVLIIKILLNATMSELKTALVAIFLVEKHYNFLDAAYVYAGNNPVMFNDPLVTRRKPRKKKKSEKNNHWSSDDKGSILYCR